jgi:nucleotide-binding universal stress UspA family protein
MRIVVGVDGSPHAREALRWALREARLRNVPVLAVHAYHSPMTSIDVAPAYVDLRPGALALVEDEVAKALADVGLDTTVECYVAESDAAMALVRRARPDDLLVVGAGRHGVVAGALLGSVSQYVTCHAPCPVVIVRRSTP